MTAIAVVVILLFAFICVISGTRRKNVTDKEMQYAVAYAEELASCNSYEKLKHLKGKYVCIIEPYDKDYLYASGIGVYARSIESKPQTHKDEIYWQLEFVDQKGRAIIKHKNGAHLHRSSYSAKDENPALEVRLPTDIYYKRENAVFNLLSMRRDYQQMYQIFSNGTPYFVGNLVRSVYILTPGNEKRPVRFFLYLNEVGLFINSWTITECPSPRG